MGTKKTKTSATKTKSSSKTTVKSAGARAGKKTKITRGEDRLRLNFTDAVGEPETVEVSPAAESVAPPAEEPGVLAEDAQGIDSEEDMIAASKGITSVESATSAKSDASDHDSDDSDDSNDDYPSEDQLPTRYLKCVLTLAEIAELRDGRERQDETVEKLEAEHLQVSAKAKELKERIAGLIAEGRNTSKTIREGFEWRDVACLEKPGIDIRTGETFGKEGMLTIRIDTEEVIDWRELSAKERQGKLFDESSAPASTTKSKKYVNGKASRSDFTGSPMPY